MKVKVWDIPTRVFHWLLVLAIIGVFFTSRTEWLIEYHVAAGYVALGLVVFRILWGFAGNRYARFSEFVKGPKKAFQCLIEMIRFSPKRYLGHNPAVAWAIVAMLLLILAMTITGIATYAGEEGGGLWKGRISFDTGIVAHSAHAALAYFVVALIVVHILAALFHEFILKESIVIAMITGEKEDEETWHDRVAAMKPEEGRSGARLFVWVIASILGGLALIYLPPQELNGKSEPPLTLTEPNGAVVAWQPNPVWKAECATSCHGAFHPTLLPAASWIKIMNTLNNHFGEDITLDAKTRDEIQAYLVSTSAEKSNSEASRKILASLNKNWEAPNCISETPYWIRKHSDIDPAIFSRKSVSSKSNCAACHPSADAGSYEDRHIRIPN